MFWCESNPFYTPLQGVTVMNTVYYVCQSAEAFLSYSCLMFNPWGQNVPKKSGWQFVNWIWDHAKNWRFLYHGNCFGFGLIVSPCTSLTCKLGFYQNTQNSFRMDRPSNVSKRWVYLQTDSKPDSTCFSRWRAFFRRSAPMIWVTLRRSIGVYQIKICPCFSP